MLVNAPCLTPSLLRQCARHAATNVRPSQQLRALATSPVLRQSSDSNSSFPYTPSWIDNNSQLQPTRGFDRWGNILGSPFRAPPKVDKSTTPEEWWKLQEQTNVRHLPPPHDAYSGRSVHVFKGDVGTALRHLKTILTANNVRSQNVRDERHEKKGEKRNRLKSLRWRRRFAHEVRKRVQLVNEIRARGA
ncbi:hypothetical protein LXA43DRAFT_1090593 [Ganoderma leucocontextum]|nr:hypothetical protein LXA43DRAFT_1090593 [Ganoderma leucocontextum]